MKVCLNRDKRNTIKVGRNVETQENYLTRTVLSIGNNSRLAMLRLDAQARLRKQNETFLWHCATERLCGKSVGNSYSLLV